MSRGADFVDLFAGIHRVVGNDATRGALARAVALLLADLDRTAPEAAR